MGSVKSPQSLLEVGITIIIIPIRRGRRLRLKLLSIALEEWGWGGSQRVGVELGV